MRKTVTLFLLFAASLIAHAQTGALSGYCNLGGAHAKTSGLFASNFQQGIIPHCTITVYLTGTTTLATVYSDAISTPLANPFTANASTSTNSGAWTLWAATNAGLDVFGSGGDSPNTYPAQVPLCVDCFVTSSFTPQAGVISINSTQGNFSFTGPSVNCTGTSCVFSTTTGADLQHNGVNLPSQSILNFLDATPSLPTGKQPVTFTNDGAGGLGGWVDPASISTALVMQSATPAAGTYIRVDPSGFTINNSGGQYVSVGSKTSANVRDAGCTFACPVGAGQAEVDWTFALPSYVNPSNVTAVWASATAQSYPVGNSNGSGAVGHITCHQNVTDYTLASSNGYGPFYQLQQFNTQLSGVTGSQVSSVTCAALVSNGSVVQNGLVVDVPQIYLQLADSIDTAPATNTIQVAPPLYFNQSMNLLGLSYPLDVVTDTGAANAYVISNANINAVAGQALKFVPAHSSTSTTPTLALNGVPAQTIVGPTGGALASGDLLTTVVANVIYGPNGLWWLQNPQTASASAGFPITLGSTSIAANSTTAAVAGLSVNGVTLDATGANTLFLNKTGAYSTPAGAGAFAGGLGASYQDVTEIAAPANPSAGNDRLFTNSSTHKLACLTSGGADCMPSAGGGGTPGTPAGSMQVYKSGSTFGGTQTWVFEAGVNGAACDHTADDTTAFVALVSTVSGAGGGTISYQCNGLFNSAEITIPNNIRITGLIPSANGQWGAPPNTTAYRMDLQFNATDAKLVWLSVGGGEIDHLNLVDTAADCAPFILDTNTTLGIHDNLFSGTATGTSACNDAIILGGTTATAGNLPSNMFQGYGTYVNHNFFDKIRRGVFLRDAANAVPVKDNTFSARCGATISEAAIQIGFAGVGQAQSNIFSGNIFEVNNYPYTYAIYDSHNLVFGDTFWDATGTTSKLFHFVSGTQNIASIAIDSTIAESKVSDAVPLTDGNSVMDQAWQAGVGLAGLNGRLCKDTSGSGTAQTCNTPIPFTPQSGAWIIYRTTTDNTGNLTINVNGLGAKSVAKWQGTTTLSAQDIRAGADIPMFYDGTNWETATIGNAPAGLVANTTITVASGTFLANTCTSTSTATMTGVATSSVFDFTPSADPTAVTGWGGTGGLTIAAWPTANTLNYKVCNQTASSITTGSSVTFNVGAR